MSTGLAWQIPYEHLAEFAFVFRQLIFEVRSSKTVYKFFSWYYSIQNEFEEDKRFTNEEYEKTMRWLDDITSEQSISQNLDVFSCVYSEYVKSLYKHCTHRSYFMSSKSLIERFLRRFPEEKYNSENPQY